MNQVRKAAVQNISRFTPEYSAVKSICKPGSIHGKMSNSSLESGSWALYRKVLWEVAIECFFVAQNWIGCSIDLIWFALGFSALWDNVIILRIWRYWVRLYGQIQNDFNWWWHVLCFQSIAQKIYDKRPQVRIIIIWHILSILP